MKNIHVLPTDKPSRLSTLKNKLVLFNTEGEGSMTYHIYITSDEEIKEGDYFWKPDCNMIFKAEYTPHKGCQKVILTTDQDLIADGVQSIDDDFLEWFVNNPSCEFVEVIELKYKSVKTNYTHSLRWGIIIPKEEPKTGSITECIKMIIDNQLNELEELKQDTFITAVDGDGEWLSPVATERVWQEEQLANIFEHYPNASPKWQYMNGLIQNSLDAKKMFSEEEVRRIAKWSFYFHKTNDFSDSELADEWELRLEKMFKNK